MCNHPELFERRDAKSPIYFRPCVLAIPSLVYYFNARLEKMLILQKGLVFAEEYIEYALSNKPTDTIFFFLRLLSLSSTDIHRILHGNILHRYECEHTDKSRTFIALLF